MTYEWTNGAATGHGSLASALVGVNTLALVVGAPNSFAKLQRTEFHFLLTLAGTGTGVSITPDWPLDQVCAAVCEAQFAGDTAIPDPYGVRTSGTVLYAPVEFAWGNQSFATSQGSVVLETRGLLVSKAQRNTPPAGGWQVAAGFTWNDDAGFVVGFGSGFRWHWRAEMACLWRL